jgi:hypothetical protein
MPNYVGEGNWGLPGRSWRPGLTGWGSPEGQLTTQKGIVGVVDRAEFQNRRGGSAWFCSQWSRKGNI